MNDLIKSWLAALRSGKYKQGASALQRDGRFCCLGVLCDVADPTGWRGAYAVTRCVPYTNSSSVDISITMPPPQVSHRAGWSLEFEYALMGLNDSVGFSFEQIADYAEGKINNGSAFRSDQRP